MKIRVFGSANCKNCHKLRDDLKSLQISYVFVDALADETQKFCDKHKVNKLPHVQVIDVSGRMVLNKAGYISATQIKDVIEQDAAKRRTNRSN